MEVGPNAISVSFLLESLLSGNTQEVQKKYKLHDESMFY